MKQLQKGLESAAKTLNTLAKKIDAISKKMERAERAKPAPAIKSPAKTTKKPAASKSIKKNAPKKAAAPTAPETVLKIIGRSKNGVNTDALMKKTGFNAKKVQNVIFRLKKRGKIKSPKKGVYVKA